MKKDTLKLIILIFALIGFLVWSFLGIGKELNIINIPETKKIEIDKKNTDEDKINTKNIANDNMSSAEEDETYYVEKVIDGDTFILSTGEKVRLIGVDTPETVKKGTEIQFFGKEASSFTKSTLEGKKIYLERDISDKDQYGRLLRYVYLEDGTFFNSLLLEKGFAKISTFPPDVKFVDLFLEKEKIARENNIGLWNNSDLLISYNNLIKGNPNSKIYHMPDGYYYDTVKNPVFFDTEKEAIAAGYRKSSK